MCGLEPVRACQSGLAEVFRVGRCQRPLIGRRHEVGARDVWVVEVDDRLLDGAREQSLGLAHEVLVERVLAGDEHGPAVPGPAGPAPALQQAGDGAGEAGDEAEIERADIDAELERRRCDDAVELVAEELALDLATLLRCVAGAVGLDAVGGAGVAVLEPAPRSGVDQLGGLARGSEADQTRAVEDRLGDHVARLGQRAPPRAHVGVHERRVPEDGCALGVRRAVLRDCAERQTDKLLGERLRVGDRRRGEDELRVRAVRVAEAAQAAHDLGDVRAEDAAVHVRLVEHDVPQAVDELGPALVVGQDADVQHVGVGEHDRGAGADLGALVLWRVAVVDRRHHAAQPQRAQLARLVLRQRLGGVEVERATRLIAEERVECRQGEAERLAAGGAGGDDHVLACAQQVEGFALVAVEAFHALPHQRLPELRRKLLRDRRPTRRPGRPVGD